MLNTALIPATEVVTVNPTAVLRRYEAMCGAARQLPARAWMAIADRLEDALAVVEPHRRAKYQARFEDAGNRVYLARARARRVLPA